MIPKIDPTLLISRHFTYHEALYLPQYGRMAGDQDGVNQDVLDALQDLFLRMDGVRDALGIPIRVHVAYRSPAYNALVGGAAHSAHIARVISEKEHQTFVAAVDWSAAMGCRRIEDDCDAIRAKILPLVPSLGLRMEKKPGASWVHLDTKPVPLGGNVYFNP